jgi:hypothetical protein
MGKEENKFEVSHKGSTICPISLLIACLEWRLCPRTPTTASMTLVLMEFQCLCSEIKGPWTSGVLWVLWPRNSWLLIDTLN